MSLNNKFMSFLGLIVRSGNVSFGYNPVKDGVYKDKIRLILLASNLSERSKDKILTLAGNKNIECIEIFETMEDISGFLGKYSGILGISDQGMALNLKKIINEDFSGRN